MAEGIPSAFPVDLTRKWLALAERRKAHLVDLYESGRWRLYYSEPEFIQRLREAVGAVERWSATERSAADRTAALPIGRAGVADAGQDDAADETLSELDDNESAGYGDTADGLISDVAVDDGGAFNDGGAAMLAAAAALEPAPA